MNGEGSCWIEVLNEDWAGPLKLRVRGRSMWPTLHPDDQVIVEPTTTDDLHPGDWVLLQGRDTLFLHRFLGFTREGLLLTKGDGHRAPDSPWPSDALRGRAVAISRHGKITPVSSSSLRERVRTLVHRLMATAWSFVRRCVRRAGLLAFLLLGVSITTVVAAVTLVSFTATPQEDSILIEWETASEVDMFGFYVQRAPFVTPYREKCTDVPDRDRISNLFQSKGDIAGADYDFTDTSAEAGHTYYYCLEAVETNSSFELHGPITAAISIGPITEPTSTPSPIPSSAPPPPPPAVTSTPTSTPEPTSTSATDTPPTATPTPTPAPTRTPTYTPATSEGGKDTPTETPPPTSTQTPMSEPTAVIATVVPEPDVDPSNATATPDPDPTSQPTGTPIPVAQATVISPTDSGRPKPSPSPTPSSTLPTHSSANGKDSPFPWGLILALITTAGILILLGGLGLWMRQKR